MHQSIFKWLPTGPKKMRMNCKFQHECGDIIKMEILCNSPFPMCLFLNFKFKKTVDTPLISKGGEISKMITNELFSRTKLPPTAVQPLVYQNKNTQKKKTHGY